MAADIVFDQSHGDTISLQGDSISLEAARVRLTGRITLPVLPAAQPRDGGEHGDLVVTVEETRNELLNISTATTRLWLCVPPEGTGRAEPGQTWWREIQLGPATAVTE